MPSPAPRPVGVVEAKAKVEAEVPVARFCSLHHLLEPLHWNLWGPNGLSNVIDTTQALVVDICLLKDL